MSKRKNKCAVQGEDGKLNMTPMIDMTFLLVVFLMLTIDLSQKEYIAVELPFAYTGVEDSKENADETPRLVINLEAEGNIVFKGQTYSLSSADPAGQEKALRALRASLVELTSNPAYREDDGSSMVPVLIHGDRMAKWKYVQWIMQVCAHPSIQVYKLQFAVKKPATGDERGN